MGDEKALNRVVPLLFPDVRRISRRHLARRPAGHKLDSGALVNEAYLKLIRAGRIRCENRVHFLALFSQACCPSMRPSVSARTTSSIFFGST
jgi:hypothetical protein